jgi:energy-converting hydrogenase Eha subunit A
MLMRRRHIFFGLGWLSVFAIVLLVVTLVFVVYAMALKYGFAPKITDMELIDKDEPVNYTVDKIVGVVIPVISLAITLIIKIFTDRQLSVLRHVLAASTVEGYYSNFVQKVADHYVQAGEDFRLLIVVGSEWFAGGPTGQEYVTGLQPALHAVGLELRSLSGQQEGGKFREVLQLLTTGSNASPVDGAATKADDVHSAWRIEREPQAPQIYFDVSTNLRAFKTAVDAVADLSIGKVTSAGRTNIFSDLRSEFRDQIIARLKAEERDTYVTVIDPDFKTYSMLAVAIHGEAKRIWG